MNERIKELHDKAFDGIDILEPNWFLKHNKKFAELIVRECAKIVEDSTWNLPHVYKAVDQAKLVKQHFGVEE